VRDPPGRPYRRRQPRRRAAPDRARLGRILGSLSEEGFLARERGRLRLP
jgi:hypothetical protein